MEAQDVAEVSDPPGALLIETIKPIGEIFLETYAATPVPEIARILVTVAEAKKSNEGEFLDHIYGANVNALDNDFLSDFIHTRDHLQIVPAIPRTR